jgi:DNA-binding MarR family transcriptional regulator
MSEIKTTVTEQLEQLQMLMHRASFHNFMGDRTARNPLRGQGRVLAILKMKPEISQRELTYLLNMSKQSLSELLAKLEKNGHVVRESSEDDKRVMTIKLTEEGMKAANDVDDETSEAAKILDCLNGEELSVFSGYLGRIIKRYEEQFPDDDFEERRKMLREFMSHQDRGRRPDGPGGWHGGHFFFGDFGCAHGHH